MFIIEVIAFIGCFCAVTEFVMIPLSKKLESKFGKIAYGLLYAYFVCMVILFGLFLWNHYYGTSLLAY